VLMARLHCRRNAHIASGAWRMGILPGGKHNLALFVVFMLYRNMKSRSCGE